MIWQVQGALGLLRTFGGHGIVVARRKGRVVVGGMNDDLLAGHGGWLYAAMRTVRAGRCQSDN